MHGDTNGSSSRDAVIIFDTAVKRELEETPFGRHCFSAEYEAIDDTAENVAVM